MKKINTEALEKMAKEKNIDKDMIENIANSYKGKSENELMDELIKIGQNLKGKEQVVSKFKSFLDADQQKKLDTIMTKISEAEIQSKVDNKKNKNTSNSNGSNQVNKKYSSDKNNGSSNTEKSSNSNSGKKVKKVVKKVKRPKS